MLQFINTIQQYVFSSELDVLRFSSDSKTLLTFTINDVPKYSTSFIPGRDGTCWVYGLDKIFSASRTENIVGCSISLTNESGENVTAEFTCIYCSASINSTASFFLNNYFLIATGSDKKSTAPGRKESFWVLHTEGERTITRKCFYIDSNKAVTTVSYTYQPAVAALQPFNITFDPADFEQADKLLFCIEFSDGTRKLTYDVDTRRDKDVVLFKYENIFGYMDFICFTGLKETEYEAELESGQINGQWINIRSDVHPVTKIHSGYIPKDEIYPYIAFISSPQRTLIDKSGYETDIAITEQETKYSNDNSQLVDFSISYRKASDTLVVQVGHNKIFDKTFDQTFN